MHTSSRRHTDFFLDPDRADVSRDDVRTHVGNGRDRPPNNRVPPGVVSRVTFPTTDSVLTLLAKRDFERARALTDELGEATREASWLRELVPVAPVIPRRLLRVLVEAIATRAPERVRAACEAFGRSRPGSGSDTARFLRRHAPVLSETIGDALDPHVVDHELAKALKSVLVAVLAFVVGAMIDRFMDDPSNEDTVALSPRPSSNVTLCTAPRPMALANGTTVTMTMLAPCEARAPAPSAISRGDETVRDDVAPDADEAFRVAVRAQLARNEPARPRSQICPVGPSQYPSVHRLAGILHLVYPYIGRS